MTLATIDLTTLGKSPPKIDKMDTGPFGGFVVGKKTRSVYYTRSELVDGRRVSKAYSTNLDTHATREIGTLPIGRGGSGLAINADETLLGGSYIDLPPQGTTGGDGNAAGKGDAASGAAPSIHPMCNRLCRSLRPPMAPKTAASKKAVWRSDLRSDCR